MNKKILVICLVMLMLVSLVALTACSGNEVVLSGTQHGKISSSAKEAKEGKEVTITLTPDQGYRVEKVTIDGVEKAVVDNKVTFTMPDHSVNVKATFVENKFAVNVAPSVGGTIVADPSYAPGAQVTLTAQPSLGYAVQSVVVDGTPVSLTGNNYVFTMPAKDVDVSATFIVSSNVVSQIPQGSVATISANAVAGGTATSEWFLQFNDDNLQVDVYVEDATVLAAKDGVLLYFGNSSYSTSVTASNLCVKVDVSGNVSVSAGSNGSFVAANNGGATATVLPLSLQQGKIDGYVLSVQIPYAMVGVSKDNVQSSLTMLPYLLNGDRSGTAFGSTQATLDDHYSHANPNSYPLVSVHGFRENSVMFGTGELGSYKDILLQGMHWDVTRDYPADDANYSNRVAYLNNHDGDNNLAFIRSAGTTSYAKATFKVNAVHNHDELWPKFGFMVYDTQVADSGVFFYVDAKAEGVPGQINLTNIYGTELGYATQQRGAWQNWTTLSGTVGMFNVNTKTITLSICYNNGFVYFFVEQGGKDVLVGVTTYKAQGDIVIGIKSFGLGLEVTNYKATNDPSSEEFISHNSREDGLTIGDNASGYAYTEGWSFYGDMAENTGGGDQIIYIKDVLSSANFYAQAKFSTPGKVGNLSDEYTKAGAVIKNENYTIMGYVDLNDHTAANNRVVCNFAVRFESGERKGQWIWEAGVSSSFGVTVENQDVEIAIAKLGARVYLLMNGELVASYYNEDIEDQNFVAGIMGFNRRMSVSEGSGTMDVEQVREKVGLITQDNAFCDGVLDDGIWTKEVMDATQTFADLGDGRRVDVAAVKGENGVYVALTLYTNTLQRKFTQAVSWSETCNVEFRLKEMSDSNKGNRNLVHYIAFYDFLTGPVTTSASFLNANSKLTEITLENGQKGYKTVVEFFIPYTYFDNPSAEKLPFYVWTASFDEDRINMAAMNVTYNEQIMYVTANGLVMEDK